MSKWHDYYEFYKGRLCVQCRQVPPKEGSVRCPECLEKKREYEKKYRESRSEERKRAKENRRKYGICTECGEEKATEGYVTCELCREYKRIATMDSKKKYREKNREVLNKKLNVLAKSNYDSRKENGLCVKCGKPNDTKYIYCSVCKGKDTERKRKYRKTQSDEVRKKINDNRSIRQKNKYYYRKENGLCTKCGKPNDTKTVYCTVCREKTNEQNRRKKICE